MDKNKQTAPIKEFGRYMKTKMFFARIMGLIFCLVCAGALALLYFKIVDKWTIIVIITFAMACIFMSNSFLQTVKAGRGWQVFNLLLAFVCYAAVITFVTIGILEGTIKIGF